MPSRNAKYRGAALSMATLLHLLSLALSAIVLAADATSNAVTRTIPLHYPGLYPESIDWDNALGIFIAGSLAQGSLFSITEDGKVEQFIHDVDYGGIAATVGVTVDSDRRRILTVINNVFDHPLSFHGLAAYNLDTKARIFLAKLSEASCPNDVTIDPSSGFAYVTDSALNLIMKINPSGNSSVFTEDILFKSQHIVVSDPVAVGVGLNGIAFTEDYMLVVQSNSGKLFRVMANDATVHVVDVGKLLVAGDGVRLRQDGLLIVVSTDVLWVLKSRDSWTSAFVVEEILLDRSFNSTSVALKGPKDDATIVHAYFQEYFEKGMENLSEGELRSEFSLQKIQLPGDPDNNPLWLLLIVVLFLGIFGFYKLQMKSLVDKYSQLSKRD